jgi:hypothetical protein
MPEPKSSSAAAAERPGAVPPGPKAPPEPLYEVVTDTWGARAPVYRKGNTFVPSMLPSDRDLEWAERQLIVTRVPPEDPRQQQPPTGPTGDQTGVPGDGWINPANPEFVPPQAVPQILQAMRAAGASAAMIEAVRAQAAIAAIPVPVITTPTPPAATGEPAVAVAPTRTVSTT